uniref:acid phosphatase n=1 Tax=Panagrolaimus superbus TaxID=310955 RepID=A0A914YQS2_9BILA
MILLLIKIFMIFVSLISLALCDETDEGTLLFVQTIWRHGDRTPTETFTYDQTQTWKEGWGELTEKGMRQHLNLGKKLRSVYVDHHKFLSSNYKSNEIYVRSTGKG